MIQITLKEEGDIDCLSNMISALLVPGKKIDIFVYFKEQCYLEPVVELFQQNESIEPLNLERTIDDLLMDIGIPHHILGYRYIMIAIQKVIEDPEKMKSITKLLYPEIATKFKTTPSRVERAIRHAIEVAWNPRNVEANNRMFVNTINSPSGRPTNSAFIALLADRVCRQLNLA